MRTPRVNDFDPNAKSIPDLASPLDNYPAIIKPTRRANEQPSVPQPQATISVSSTMPALQQRPMMKKEKPENLETGKPESPLPRKPASPKTNSSAQEKPKKYSTQLSSSLVKRIRLHAIENDCKDYEIVERAITEYLAKNH